MLRRSLIALVGIAAAFGVILATVEAYGLRRPSGEGSHLGAQNFALIDRGRQLAIAADCQSCHTRPGGEPFAGGRPIETPFGTVVAPNITPDRETGIGTWSDAEFDAALRRGIRPNGLPLYPAMPYPYFTKLSRDDVQAMRAYFNTLPAVHNSIAADQLPFPLSLRVGMFAWNWLYFRAGDRPPVAGKSAAWNRGADLVEALGHCGACHTPKTLLGGDDDGHALQGGVLQGWFAPDLTDNVEHGLGRWNVEDIVAYLKYGHNSYSGATGPMAEEITLSSSRMPAEDLQAIATYLKELPGDGTQPPGRLSATDPPMLAGAAIYRDACSACHDPGRNGVAGLFPSLARSSNLRSTNPTSLIRIVLRGARMVATDAAPTAPAMPSFGRELSNEQIAAVLTYLRNVDDPASAAVKPEQVEVVRKDVASRDD